ncbi:MAG: hypothetical protein C6W57_15570 [Caldibacillus debilis]|jgi:hypothetical protein|uniref:hypothetical protein n=1 Tax=Caldibacillus debilis TaxID=301148 RepID=UPI000B586EA7|nr:hypothetical protein [Caldibacillus debilis]MBO2480907.1 hypothetical protein [Bacillaceae bacterium]MBY6270602.1 hypothetical protein [Bacillaceae bacterium]OUM89203.1 MAG: hypothetical protein BAA03_07730 [Caldibacillus debilis]REJ13846.1 MAG: hypothetical protein C6W57_15570 [Caldibacillus debilis]REJ28231.1 MAG: hypothetical protein C6W56_08680 [Caldibacillus debilis]
MLTYNEIRDYSSNMSRSGSGRRDAGEKVLVRPAERKGTASTINSGDGRRPSETPPHSSACIKFFRAQDQTKNQMEKASCKFVLHDNFQKKPPSPGALFPVEIPAIARV